MFERKWRTYFLLSFIAIIYVLVNIFLVVGPAVLAIVSPWFYSLYIVTIPGIIASGRCFLEDNRRGK